MYALPQRLNAVVTVTLSALPLYVPIKRKWSSVEGVAVMCHEHHLVNNSCC